MNAPTEYQKIEYNGKPAYILVPYEDWGRIRKLIDGQKARISGIPQEVVEAHILGNDSIIKAWREFLGLTQKDLAVRLGVSQAAVVKFERPGSRPRIATIRKIADALGLSEDQLMAE